MTDINLNELRGIAEAQAEAYRVMLLIGEGVGGLGVRHPERYESMLAWDDMSANGHADTVLTLLSRLESAEKVIAEALAFCRGQHDSIRGQYDQTGGAPAEYIGFANACGDVVGILSAYTKGTDRD